MATSLFEERLGSPVEPINQEWVSLSDRAYECRVLLVPESEGGYSAHATRLPGVVSEGETIEEALANVGEAFAGAVRAYLDSGRDIPWGNAEVEKTPGAEERWIVVNV